jgi:hypothetical protein
VREMSLELRLLPLALTALAEVESQTSPGGSVILESRFKDVVILQEALEKMQLESRSVASKNQEQKTEALAIKNDRLAFTFVPSDAGNFLAIFPPGSQLKSCEELLSKITEEYGRVLQAKLIQRIERSAAASGFRLGSRAVNNDRSVTLTLGLS